MPSLSRSLPSMLGALLLVSPVFAQDEEVVEFDFSDEDALVTCVINETDSENISKYADALLETRAAFGRQMFTALGNFRDTMSFPSSHEAKPRVAKALLDTAFEEARDALVKAVDEKVPGVEFVVKSIESASEEIERAAAASDGVAVRDFITTQRTILSNRMVGDDAGGDQLRVHTTVKLREEIEEAICPLDEEAFQQEMDGILQALSNLGQVTVPKNEVYELGLYEAWINGNFDDSNRYEASEKTKGSLDIRVELESKWPLGSVDLLPKCTVSAPFGDKVADGLERTMPVVSRVVSPLDLRVRKKVCFYVENIVGGTQWDCSWLDADNDVRVRPGLPEAEKAFDSNVWRTLTLSCGG